MKYFTDILDKIADKGEVGYHIFTVAAIILIIAILALVCIFPILIAIIIGLAVAAAIYGMAYDVIRAIVREYK